MTKNNVITKFGTINYNKENDQLSLDGFHVKSGVIGTDVLGKDMLFHIIDFIEGHLEKEYNLTDLKIDYNCPENKKEQDKQRRNKCTITKFGTITYNEENAELLFDGFAYDSVSGTPTDIAKNLTLEIIYLLEDHLKKKFIWPENKIKEKGL